MKNKIIKQIKNLSDDFEIYTEEYKEINNNLAVPLYRKFCKEYGLNFHFADEIKKNGGKIDNNRIFYEMKLHDEALNLFNYLNTHYYPFRGRLVSFYYETSVDFHYENLTLSEVAVEMENKDIMLKKLEKESTLYLYTISILFFIISIIIGSILSSITRSDLLFYFFLILGLLAPTALFSNIYEIKRKSEYKKFEKRLSELKGKLNNIDK